MKHEYTSELTQIDRHTHKHSEESLLPSSNREEFSMRGDGVTLPLSWLSVLNTNSHKLIDGKHMGMMKHYVAHTLKST